MAAQFEAENPGIKVNVTVLPESAFDEKMNTALGAGVGAPDVAYFWDTNWYPQALDLTPYLENDAEIKRDIYVEGLFDTRSVWQDKIVGLPLGAGANFVMYNKDIFDEAGVPYPTADWTADEYVELVIKLNSSELRRWGGDRPRGPFRAVFYNYGAFPYSDDSMTVEGYLNGEASVAAYTWLWDLVNSDGTPTPADLEVLSTEGTGPIDLFLAGRLAMATLNQGHALTAIRAGINFGIVPEPTAPGGERYVNAWSLTTSIWKGTEHPDEAWQFLRYWAGPRGQQILSEQGDLVPSISTMFGELPKYRTEQIDIATAFFDALKLKQVYAWDVAHPCKTTVLRSVVEIWDLIMINEIGRDEIKAKLDSLVAPAQAALDECRARLGA
jgi:multiple sugar transport system substrate-binding protein